MGMYPSASLVFGVRIGDWYDWRTKEHGEYALPTSVTEQFDEWEQRIALEDGFGRYELEVIYQGEEQVAFGQVISYWTWDSIDEVDPGSLEPARGPELVKLFRDWGIEPQPKLFMVVNYS